MCGQLQPRVLESKLEPIRMAFFRIRLLHHAGLIFRFFFPLFLSFLNCGLGRRVTAATLTEHRSIATRTVTHALVYWYSTPGDCRCDLTTRLSLSPIVPCWTVYDSLSSFPSSSSVSLTLCSIVSSCSCLFTVHHDQQPLNMLSSPLSHR